MRVSDVMTPRADLVTATVPGSREDVLDVLQEREFSSVPVVKRTNGTEIYRGLVSRERLIEDPDEEQLALLIEEVDPIEPDVELEALAKHMVETGARRVPVVDSGLDGIVTITDVVRAIANGGLSVDAEVGDFADDRVHTIYVETPLLTAERSLFYSKEPYAVVLNATGKMTGILTEVDIIAVAKVVEGTEGTGDSIANQDSEWAWEGIKAIGNRILPTRNVELPDKTVGDVMTKDVVTVPTSRSVTDTAQLLIRHDVEQIPLMQGEKIVGVIKDMDLLEAVYE